MGVIVNGYKWEDKGLIVSGTSMAAGATVYSNWFDSVDWVRNLIYLAQSDQQYDVKVQRRDSSGAASGDGGLSADAQALTGVGVYRTHINSNSFLGWSARFGMKNSSASANTVAILRMQFLG